MAISRIGTYQNTYASTVCETGKDNNAKSSSAATEAGKDTSKVSTDKAEISPQGKAKLAENTATSSSDKTDRSAIVEFLKQDLEDRKKSLIDLVQQSISKQGAVHSKRSEDSMWKLFAKGKINADEVSVSRAQEEISEDGYWGVNQTSQRLFDFAMSLAGDDTEKMEEMQKAFEKGYSMAEKAWGQTLPSICQKTYDAVQEKFQDYYDSKKTV
jgi:hypothetical protein